MSQPLCGYEGILFLCYLGIFVGVGVFVFGFRLGGLALLGCRFAATATTATFFGGFAVVFGLLVVGDFECRGFDDGSGQQCRCCRGLGVGGAFVCFFLFGSCRKCRGDFGFRLRPRFRLRGRGRLLPGLRFLCRSRLRLFRCGFGLWLYRLCFCLLYTSPSPRDP